jgi:hypothetical protein
MVPCLPAKPSAASFPELRFVPEHIFDQRHRPQGENTSDTVGPQGLAASVSDPLLGGLPERLRTLAGTSRPSLAHLFFGLRRGWGVDNLRTLG